MRDEKEAQPKDGPPHGQGRANTRHSAVEAERDQALTALRESEQQYRHLEGRIEERTAELRAMNESLQRESAERRRLIERQRRLMEIAAAVNASQELDPILRLVRDAVIEAGDFDRAGVFRVEGSAVYGAWGTNESGGLMDAHGIVETLDDWGPDIGSLISGESQFYIEELTEDARPIGSENVSIPHVVVALRAGGELVGLLSADNLLSGRPVLAADVQPLLPFAEQAAVAIQNARLFQELRRTQDALVHSEKLRAVGELASGIAHNVNNVLAVVLGYAELIPLAEGDTEQIEQYAGIIAKAAEHGADIVRRMQQFARKETDAGREVFDLAEIAREAIEFARPAWFDQALGRGVRIGVETALQGELWVRGVASELRDVIVNLIKNAVDAMPAGGLLTLRGFVEADEVILAVTDTGHGMDESVRRRIFEPFFTTKRIGQGTGLGLSVAWGILNRHQGRITVQSAPGQGATFRLHLPPANATVMGAKPTPAPTPLAGMRLLVVDDEIHVLGSLARSLEASGAVITAVVDAFQALKVLEARGAEFDMVVTDQGMPNMTGTELLSEIRRRWPPLRRVLLSGWGPNLPEDADSSAAELILGKPLSRQALAHALSGLLSSTVGQR